MSENIKTASFLKLLFIASYLLYELVREQYNKVNKEYLEEQRQKALQYQKCSQCRHFVYDADCLETWMCERLHEGKDCKFEVYERY